MRVTDEMAAGASVKNVDTSSERDKKGDDSLHDKRVEAVARSLAALEPGEAWPTNAELGGSLTGTRDDEYRSAVYEEARAALVAADAVVTERELELLAHEHAREEYGVGLRAVDQRVAFEQGALFALALFRGGVK